MARSRYDLYLANSTRLTPVRLVPFRRKKVRIFSTSQDLTINWTLNCLDIPISLHSLQLTSRVMEGDSVLIYSCTTGRAPLPKPLDFPNKSYYITTLWTISSYNQKRLIRYSSFQTPSVAGGGNESYL